MHLEGALVGPAVPTGGRGVHLRAVPRHRHEAIVQAVLVGLDHEQVAAAAAGQPAGMLTGGVQRIGGDHRPLQGQVGQHPPQPADLAGALEDLPLAQHGAVLVVQGSQQVHPDTPPTAGTVPRTALPSTAIARSPPGRRWVTAACQAHNSRSTITPSRRPSTRRTVASVGATYRRCRWSYRAPNPPAPAGARPRPTHRSRRTTARRPAPPPRPVPGSHPRGDGGHAGHAGQESRPAANAGQ
jgi:hypothetical protein